MTVPQHVPAAFADALLSLGFIARGDVVSGEALAGGVSSDVWRIDLPDRPVCAKRALAQLRVAADWSAPVRRHHHEAAFLRLAGAQFPGRVPALLGHEVRHGVVVMEYFPAQTHKIWKAMLRDGDVDPATAASAGQFLAAVHRTYEDSPDARLNFDDLDLFSALRLQPYFIAAAERNAGAWRELHALVELFAAHRTTLIHGDFSPKNMLVGPDGAPVLVDAETATLGDPAFDVAFFLTHLLLKAVWKPQFAELYKASADAFMAAYFLTHTSPVESRAARYLAGFLLARVDGKSPVEYLTDDRDRALVRQFALNALAAPENALTAMTASWYHESRNFNAQASL